MRAAARLQREALRTALRLIGPLLHSPKVSPAQQRRRADLATAVTRVPAGTRIDQATVGGVAAERLTPPGAAPDGVLLFLHGGGYTIGSPRSHRGLVGALAARTGLPGLTPAYRLAPEHPHPAALVDVLAVYRGLLDDGNAPQRIAVVGDSAGAGLALALAMALRDDGVPLPAVLGLICPWVDLTADIAGSRPPAPGEPVITRKALTSWASAYAAAADPSDPAISPLFGDLGGLPPLVVHYGGDDLLCSDAERLVDGAQAAGTSVEARRYDGLWHDFHVLLGILGDADRAIAELGNSVRRRLAPTMSTPRIAVVGAGMSGLCMGAKLREAGIESFTIHEKADEVGGTWRENRYPGLSCDVPSRFYSYSFAPNPGWTHAFAPGPEIQTYFTEIADRLDLRRFVRFGSEISSARWQDGAWQLRTVDGAEDRVDVLVSAAGVLHHPRLPEIDGLDRFAGAVFHSARWDDSQALAGRRVAVIGTGSTGVQITTALAGQTGGLKVFQRTAQWVLPVPNTRYTQLTRRAFRRLPSLNRAAYRLNQAVLEAVLGVAVVRPGWQRSTIGAICRLNLRFGVRDPELRRRLTPDYQPMCKRLVMSAGFYRAMQRSDVELVTESIDRVEPRGIVTADGRLHEADVIVLATGFDAHAYMRPIELVGEDGVTLEDVWADGPRAYRTVSLPGFPNFFMLMGPHSPIGNQSLIAVAETQADYAMRWIRELWRGAVASVSPTQEATTSFNAEMRQAMPTTVFATGCRSWYLGKDGLPELWPWTPRRHRAMLSEPERDDHVVRPAARALGGDFVAPV